MKPSGLIASWPVPSPAMAIVRPGDVRSFHGSSESTGRWASVTKMVTAYSVLIGVGKGHWGLDEPAGPPGSTVRHLLAHASGLPFEGQVPIAAPGRRRIYSNAGFDLLGEFVTERTGRAFGEVLEETVLGPLGVHASLVGRPSEGLAGTVTGLASLAGEFLAPSLLSLQLLSLATAAAFPPLAGTLPGVGRFDPLDWGLGFEIKGRKVPHWTGGSNSPETFGHFGRSGAFLWIDPLARIGLCVQTGRDFGPWALEAWPLLSDAVLSEPPTASDPPTF